VRFVERESELNKKCLIVACVHNDFDDSSRKARKSMAMYYFFRNFICRTAYLSACTYCAF
jgi:hypothetical protein